MNIDPIFSILVLIISVVIHEVSHGYMADFLGDPTAKLAGRLTLNPIKHLDLWGSIIIPLIFILTPGGFIFGWAKPVPYNPYNLRGRWGLSSRASEAMVAFAGPLSNISVAVFFGILVRLGFFNSTLITPVASIVLINLVLAIFNLIPIPPLDGSKILFSILPLRFADLRFKLERSGFILVLLFIFFLWQLFVPLIFFIFSLLTGL